MVLHLTASQRELTALVQSFHAVIVIETVEEERIHNLLAAVANDLHPPIPVFEWSLTLGLLVAAGTKFAPRVNEYAPPGNNRPVPVEKTQGPVEVLQYAANMERPAIFWLKDFAAHFTDPLVVRHFREVSALFSQKRSVMILSGDRVELPKEVMPDAVFFDLKLPTADELYQTLSETSRYLKAKYQVQIALEGEHFRQMVQALRGMTLRQARQVIAYAAMLDQRLSVEDVPLVLQRKARVIEADGLLEFFPLEVNRPQLGGFLGLKNWLSRAKLGFSEAARVWNLPFPKGILIVGIQGCGKSLAAKTIAREWRLPLLKLDAGRLYDKYVGESEKNFRLAVTVAESMAPVVLWIDEIEKSFGQSDEGDGGLSRRLFGFFLTWLQEKSQEVFVVATANDLSRLPPELLRKGRFDEIFFVDLPDAQERKAILAIHLKLRQQNLDSFDLDALVKVTAGFSGAEIEQGIITALYEALHQGQEPSTLLIAQSFQGMVPLSVARKEDVDRLRLMAKTRFVGVK